MGYTRKLRIGTDGTVAYAVNTLTGYSYDSTYLMGLSDTNISDAARWADTTSTFPSLTAGFPLLDKLADRTVIFFNQATRVTKFNAYQNGSGSCQMTMEYSTTTTDGITDGSWLPITFNPADFGLSAWAPNTPYVAGDMFSHSGTYYVVDNNYTSGGAWADPGTDGTNTTPITTVNFTPPIPVGQLVELNCTDIASCVAIRMEFYGETKPYGRFRIFNVYGEHTAPRFRFFDNGATEFTGDSPVTFTKTFNKYSISSELVRFTVKNTDTIDNIAHSFNIDLRNVGNPVNPITNFLRIVDHDALDASANGAGTVTKTNASNSITGTSTNFTSSDVGKIIKLSGGDIYTILAVDDVDAITVDGPVTGSATVTYKLSPAPTSSVTTGSIALNASSNLILSFLCPANSAVNVGQSQYSIDVTAN